MDRRKFIHSTAAASALLPLSVTAPPGKPDISLSVTGTRIAYHGKAFSEPARVLFVSDTHLWQSDAREDAFRRYSQRMAGAYNQTRHFQTGEITSPMEAFEKALEEGVKNHIDLLVLGGDIFSYPSEAAVDWVLSRLKKYPIPYVYTTGNHDWHYEGMTGSSIHLRKEWTSQRLAAFFQGENPLIYSRDVKGIRFIIIDNSVYEILPEQLALFRQLIRTPLPVILVMHIPMYVPGRPVNFGCGHPDWGAHSDTIYHIEKREPWRAGGHTPVTGEFHKLVFNTPGIIGVLAGHIHAQSLDFMNGTPQFVAAANANGAFLDVTFEPKA